MKALRTSIFAAISVALFAVSAMANDFTDAGADSLWSTPENWSQGIAPLGAIPHPEFGWDDPTGPFYPLTADTSDDGPLGNNNAKLTADGATILIDSTVAAEAYGVRIGFDGVSNTLEMTGGSLQIGGQVPGAPEPVGWHLDVGRGINRTSNPDPLATFKMTGGEVRTNGFLIPESFVDDSLADPYDTPGVNGKAIISGGEITARWMNVGQFTGNGDVELSGDAVINLWPSVPSNPNNGGHFEMKRNWFILGQPVVTTADAFLDIRGDAVINIFGNRSDQSSLPNQAEIDRMQQYVDDGWLTANNGADDPIFTLQSCPADGSLDEFCLSGEMITITAPAPSGVSGDFDGTGSWDCSDIGALVSEIEAGTNDPAFDMTGDGVVDISDVTDPALGWLTVAGANSAVTGGNPFLLGDLDLDGSVGSMDLGLLLNNFAGSALYCGGDLDATGDVDSADLGQLLNNFGDSSSVALAAVAVPEPASGILVWLIVPAFLYVRRRTSV